MRSDVVKNKRLYSSFCLKGSFLYFSGEYYLRMGAYNLWLLDINKATTQHLDTLATFELLHLVIKWNWCCCLAQTVDTHFYDDHLLVVREPEKKEVWEVMLMTRMREGFESPQRMLTFSTVKGLSQTWSCESALTSPSPLPLVNPMLSLLFLWSRGRTNQLKIMIPPPSQFHVLKPSFWLLAHKQFAATSCLLFKTSEVGIGRLTWFQLRDNSHSPGPCLSFGCPSSAASVPPLCTI